MPKETFLNLPDDKRNRLVNCAIREFGDTSFLAGSLDRIAAAAGISKGSLYQYFDNKLDMYQWLLSDELPRRKQAAMTAARVPAGADIFDMLEASFLAGLAFFIAEPHLAQLGASLMGAAPTPELSALHRSCAENAHKAIRQLVLRAQENGEIIQTLDADLVAVMISRMMGTGLIDALLHKIGQDRQSLLEDGRALKGIPDDEVARLVRQSADALRRAFSPHPPRRELD